jgi:hypothetical protein
VPAASEEGTFYLAAHAADKDYSAWETLVDSLIKPSRVITVVKGGKGGAESRRVGDCAKYKQKLI